MTSKPGNLYLNVGSPVIRPWWVNIIISIRLCRVSNFTRSPLNMRNVFQSNFLPVNRCKSIWICIELLQRFEYAHAVRQKVKFQKQSHTHTHSTKLLNSNK